MKTQTFFIAIGILFLSIMANAQNIITGTVLDENGYALPGATIVAKGTSKGTVTNINGNFQLEVLKSDSVLVISFIGFETKEVTINDHPDIKIKLEPNEVALEEVVTIGYGTQKNRRWIRGRSMNKSASYAAAPQMVMMADAEASPNWNTEGYSTIHDNGFKLVSNDPLSTFSIDVDKASYSNIRRFINNGQLPPKDAVRIEEMINYFNYQYEQPKGNDPFHITTEYTSCPWNKSHNILMVGLNGKDIEKEMLPPSNLVFLLDVSGSMDSANKLGLVKAAMRMLVQELRPSDQVAIVVYAGAAGLVLESTPGNQKEKILKSIEKLHAGGSTAGGEGLKLAYKVAEKNLIENGNNRIILASDGDFNVGVSSNAEMERLVEEKRDKGIFMTVLGFGMGNYKDDKMEIIADKGNGNYAYIDNIHEARKTFISEFGGTLFTIAKDVKLQLEFNPEKVNGYRLIGYENRLLNKEDFNDDTKDAGELGAGHQVTALYEIIPTGSDEEIPTIDDLKYQKKENKARSQFSDELMTVKFRYKEPRGTKSKLITHLAKNELSDEVSTRLTFAMAVTEFGMLLRNSEFKGESNFKQVIELAKQSKGDDEEGYRGEFIRLVKSAKDLMPEEGLEQRAER